MRGVIELYRQKKIVPKDYKVDGFFIGHIVERFKNGMWESQLVASDINDDGKNFLNKFDKEKFHNHFFNGDIFSEKMLTSRSIPGVYYNQEYHTSESRGKNPYVYYHDQIIDEYFRPYSHGCFHFSDNLIKNPLFRVGTEYKVGTKKLKEMYLKDYSENIDDFIEFLIGLTTATKLEEFKKTTTEELQEDDEINSIYTNKYINDTLRSINRFLNNYLDRNIIISDYSNKNNTYSFNSPSLSGSLDNMLLWDVIGGKNMRNCSNPNCKKYYFDPGNKLNCSDRCRQVTARKRRKESGNLLPSPNHKNA